MLAISLAMPDPEAGGGIPRCGVASVVNDTGRGRDLSVDVVALLLLLLLLKVAVVLDEADPSEEKKLCENRRPMAKRAMSPPSE